MTAVLTWRRFGALALTWVLVVMGGGLLGEGVFVGWTDDDAMARVERDLTARVRSLDAALSRAAQALAGQPEVRSALVDDRLAARQLFELVQATAEAQDAPGLAITIYDPRGQPRAWSGRPGELSRDRGLDAAVGFADVDAAGLRLVRIVPVVQPPAQPAGPTRSLGAVLVERVLAAPTTTMDPERGFSLEMAVGSATINIASTAADRPADAEHGTSPSVHRFEVPDGSGQPLITAAVSREDIAHVRARWRRRVVGAAFLVLAVVAMLAVGRVQANREQIGSLPTLAWGVAGVTAAAGLLWRSAVPEVLDVSLFSPTAYRSVAWGALIRTPFDLLLTAVLLCVVVGLLVDAFNHWRWRNRTGRGASTTAATIGLIGQYAAILVGTTVLLVCQHAVLRDTVDGAAVDLLHTALQPFSTARVAAQLALVLWSAATVWVIGVALAGTLASWPAGLRRRRGWVVAPTLLLPTAVVVATGCAPVWTSTLVTLMALGLALRWARMWTWFRHTDPLVRAVATLGAVLLPALPMYVSLAELTDEARRRLIETNYAVQAAEHTDVLQQLLARSQAQIDRMPGLAGMGTPPSGADTGVLDTDRAFAIWRRTALAESRVSSAVELYDANGTLSSRFALNLPDYAVGAVPWIGAGCDWAEPYGHVAPFGSEQRRLLHTERGLCAPGSGDTGVPEGAVVVHVAQVDYESLPFVGSQSPYAELFQAGPAAPLPGELGHAVELVIYGWGLQPTFMSGRSAWAIDDVLFSQVYASRTPFWTRLVKDSTSFDVFVTNVRAGIFALGYPSHTSVDHLLHLAEMTILVLAAALVGLVTVGLAGLVFPRLRGWLVVREVRARFTLRLELWFVGVATVPVVVVAVLSQGYFADQLRADVEAGAARTAAVARSVIEESAVLASFGGQAISAYTDDALVWISQVVGQGVNLFDGPQLVATSERDLYASGLLPTRTPDMVYRALALDQAPSFVGEDSIGARRYQLAATPVRVGGREVILTVPLVSRQQEIESQIAELNRRVWGSALFFAAVVGFIGWAIARTIADPVRRLTRGTSRVARGEFLAPTSRRTKLLQRRVADGTADELDVLESDFTKMAVELDAQRRQLARTHRLEAWSEMARQVAHEIKNPLTPMQLNAEHLARVHADRGSPLSPVFEGCVEAILKQVSILRQIASEFSSYASSPVAAPVPTSLGALLDKIVEPYRTGLDGRVTISVICSPALPPLPLDPVLMQRALTNIIENALHAMPAEGSLSIVVQPEDGRVRLVATDTGVGIEPDVLARIFEPYFSTRVTGTGLGMAIAKRNVELHGGTIVVTSERGHGTTVTITLPVETGSGAGTRVA
ncbi:MAG: HAMP domain-containing sensor histidine kinase [Acidobacteria bacterium]|nr:HAMP domain-containing sensor histidine kinase [Acidobacteriota bacterium]